LGLERSFRDIINIITDKNIFYDKILRQINFIKKFIVTKFSGNNKIN